MQNPPPALMKYASSAINTVAKPKREYVDFSSVLPSHWAMHDRLENWAREMRGGDKQSGKASPMFELCKSGYARREYGATTDVPVDRSDAILVAKGVGNLPEKNRKAIQWLYLHPGNPMGNARSLAVSLQGLADLVKDGRQMLINRGV